MFRHYPIFALILFLVSFKCFAIDYPRFEKGFFWCNDQKWGDGTFDTKELLVARKGYLYVLAAGLALQLDNTEASSHYFKAPERMIEVDRPKRDKSGFEVVTYEIRSPQDHKKIEEIVIAFTGSNDKSDWFKTNFGPDKRQYKQATDYVIKTAENPKYKGLRIVVSGISLGGALAVHITKNEKSSKFVQEAWALNPSPRTNSDSKIDKRIWMAAIRGEILVKARKKFVRRLIPNSSNIGAPPDQQATDYHLIEASSVYNHFRWVLVRTILFAADIAMKSESNSENPLKDEPISIIKQSKFAACKS